MEGSNVIAGRVQRRRRNEVAVPAEDLSKHARQFEEYMIKKEKSDKEESKKRKVDMIDLRAETREWQTQYETERTRRKALLPQERLREDGQELQQKIESDDEMLVSLELSASERAKCRAEEDCLDQQTNRYARIGIVDKYRICLHGVENEDWFGRRKNYYHVRCFSHMVDLHALIPSKLKLDGATERWPLMVQLWYRHKGHIDLDKIAAHVDEQKAYLAAITERNSREIDWQLTHMRACSEEAKGECKWTPTYPPKPTLESGAARGTKMCDLEDVLKHPGCRYGIPNYLDRVL